MVETLYRDQGRLTLIRDFLGKTPDLERLCSRLAMEKAHGKDMFSVKNALSSYEKIEDLIRDVVPGFEAAAARSLDSGGHVRLRELRELLERGLHDDPSILLTEGNLIREGFNGELDQLRELRDNGRKLLEKYLEEERELTGITSLKIRYNRLIGYFFEVTKAHLPKVPPRFIRRQGIVTGERFTTDRLAGLESEINGASDRVVELERKLFLEIRNRARGLIPELSAAARRIAELDAAQSLARSATLRGWVRPQVDTKNRLCIIEGRHPVVEAHLNRGEFIPNDHSLDGEGISFALITGPNMAGKSTYLRQAALITIMAQAGSFVPAQEALVGIVDRIYCRVGASDNLARGESTFLVEMNETAHILRTATEKSLVIMDEVGRGTGTIDGLAIAWAVSEELLEQIKCRTFFATHYHELSLISHPRMVNRSMEALNRNGEIIFLRKLKEGPAAESYGLHVARLAGLPERVLLRAGSIMARLKEGEKLLHSILPSADADLSGDKAPSAAEPITETAAEGAVEVLPAGEPGSGLRLERLIEDIRSLNPDRMTPLEALNRIHTWKALISPKPESSRPKEGRKEKDKIPSLFDSY
jgi:DNA mismatch repair protein MutS